MARAALCSVAVAGCGAGVYVWASRSPTLALRHVYVHGTHRVAKAEVLKLAGISVGQNLLALDIKAVERALASHPWVKAATVTRHLPGGLALRVEERRPVALVHLSDLYLVDEEGVPFKRLSGGDEVDLPLLTGVSREEYEKTPAAAVERLREGVQIARAYAMSPEGKLERLSEVRLEPQGLALICGAGGQVVRLGAGGTEQKLTRLATIRGELRKRGLAAEVISLDNRARPNWVTVKLAGSP